MPLLLRRSHATHEQNRARRIVPDEVEERPVHANLAVRLQDGNVRLDYTADVSGSTGRSGEIVVPEMIKIGIPVHDGLGAPKYAFDARFRYRLNGGALTIWYELVRPKKVVDAAACLLLKSAFAKECSQFSGYWHPESVKTTRFVFFLTFLSPESKLLILPLYSLPDFSPDITTCA